jgi:DNA-binding response OmpR family regulator
MDPSNVVIAWLDNTIHHIFRSFESLRQVFPNAQLFSHEAELYDFLELNSPDLIVMNLDLKPNDAIHVVQELRAFRPPFFPLLVVYSLRTDELAEELALLKGADAFIDFHRKPTMLRPFIVNLLSRKHFSETSARRTQPFILDDEQHLVFVKGRAVNLPKKEFQILQHLNSNIGNFFSRKQIAAAVWKDESVAARRIIDMHIYNMRQLLGKGIIQSKKGKGYRLNEQLSPGKAAKRIQSKPGVAAG